MDERTINERIKRKELEDSLRGEFAASLSQRVKRYLEVKPHEVVPYTHFSAPSAECSLLFRDGHFYGCISLTQSVAEALVRFLCEKNSLRLSKDFQTNVNKLRGEKAISDGMSKSLLKIWEKRNEYHHLNREIEADRTALEELAKEKTRLLVGIEREVFAFEVGADGSMIPKQPKYWPQNGNLTTVFLRFHP